LPKAKAACFEDHVTVTLTVTGDLKSYPCPGNGRFTQSDRLCRTTKNRIDPICENRVVQHFQVSCNIIFTNMYMSDCVNSS
jgi:hypothetical protein